MSGTESESNNVLTKFKGRDMPSESQAQNRFMHAVAEGSVKDVPKSVGADFVAADRGRKIKKLPKHVKKAAKRGLISDKQMAKMSRED